jgi:4-alpha-glucanotransferase
LSTHLRRLVRDALDALGIRRFLLGVHDAAFPMRADEDVGRGSPHSDAAADLLELASSLGFDGIQLGPQGATSASNPSPYDAALFSREPLSIALAPLTRAEWGGLLREETLATAIAGRPRRADRVGHAYALEAVHGALGEAAVAFGRLRAERRGPVPDLARRLATFRARNAEWLERDALHDVLQRRHGGAHWRTWGDPADRALFAPAPGAERAHGARLRALLEAHAAEVDRYAFAQWLAHEQHALLRERARGLGLALFGDLQIGISERDAWYA